MNQSTKRQGGFSLIEVLVAFSIFALSLGVIFQIYSTGARSTMLSDEYTRAIIIAQSKLASIGIEEMPDIGEYTGVENDKYQWITRVRVAEEDNIDLETRFDIIKREIEVEVNWDSLGKTRSIKLNTIKLIPTS
ncbi:MAG: prepilin-type N-terminal cleavage/methylation domain-containing protein [Proteobacteria bacterium]|nr:prepilin-type N-terminal cleavage/methylation domain-containing protein [Pseudomonadota bacterium]